MNKEIEEMENDYHEAMLKASRTIVSMNEGAPKWYAKELYTKGWRKQRVGHWFFTEYEFFNCSECGEGYYNDSDSTAQTKEMLESGRFYPYCPHCGTKMEGGE